MRSELHLFSDLGCSQYLGTSVVGFVFPITRDIGDHDDSWFLNFGDFWQSWQFC